MILATITTIVLIGLVALCSAVVYLVEKMQAPGMRDRV